MSNEENGERRKRFRRTLAARKSTPAETLGIGGGPQSPKSAPGATGAVMPIYVLPASGRGFAFAKQGN